MTISAQTVVRRVVSILQDNASTRWPLNEVVRALNDGQMAILDARPDLLSATTTLTLVAGTRQTLPATALKLMRVIRNNSTASKKAVRLALMEHLDAQLPGWHSVTAAAEIAHYMEDPREQNVFWVYPPATTTAKLDVTYAALPTAIAEPAVGVALPADPVNDATAPATVIGSVSVPDDIATGALVDFILYRLYVKNSSVGDLQRATAHYQAFSNALGVEIKGKVAAGPYSNSLLSPLYPAMAQSGA